MKWVQSASVLILISFAVPLFFSVPCCTKNSSYSGKTIRFLTWKPNQPEVWEEVFQLFKEENPGISVLREIGPHSSTAFHDLLIQKLKNKSTDVDVFFMDVVWPPEFAAAGWAMPLDGYFSEAEQKSFLGGAITANTYREKIFGVPMFIDSGVLFYRKDLLERYGYKTPVTWDDLVEQANKISTEESKKGFSMTGYSGQFKQYEGLVCNMLEFILSHNGNIIDPHTGAAALFEKPAVDAIGFVRDKIIGNITSMGVLTYQEPESLDVFIQGRTVFHRNWPYAWQISNDPSKSHIAGKVAIAKLPHFEGGRSHATLGGWQLGVSNYSLNKELAWLFVQFLTSERIQKIFAVKSGKAPTRTALYSDVDVIRYNPHFQSLKDVFLTAYPRPRSPLYPSISNVLQGYFSTAISSRNSRIEVEARRAAAAIDKFVAMTR